jgi:hypothetical protein
MRFVNRTRPRTERSRPRVNHGADTDNVDYDVRHAIAARTPTTSACVATIVDL